MMACQSSRTRPLTPAATSSTSKGYDRSTQGWPFMDPIEHPYECLMCGGILWTDACIREHVGRHSYEPSPTATDHNQHKQTTSSDNPVCWKTDQLVKSTSRPADNERLDTKSKYGTASVASTRTSDYKVLYEELFTESPCLDLILQHVDFYSNNVVHLVIKIDADRYEPAANDTVNIRVVNPPLAWNWRQCGIFVNYDEWKLAGNMYHIELSVDDLWKRAELSFYEGATFVAEYLSGRTGYMILAKSKEFYVHPALPETDTSNRATNSNTHKNDSKHDYNKENNSSSNNNTNSHKIANQNSSNQNRPTGYKNKKNSIAANVMPTKNDHDDGKNNTNRNDNNNIKDVVVNNKDNSNKIANQNSSNQGCPTDYKNTFSTEDDEEDIDVETFENVSAALNELVDQPQRLSGNAAVVNVSTTSGSHVDGVTLTRADEVNAKRLVSDHCETSECKSPACKHAMAKLNTRIMELKRERLQLILVLNKIFHTAAVERTRVLTALSTATDTALSSSSSQSSLSSRAPAWLW